MLQDQKGFFKDKKHERYKSLARSKDSPSHFGFLKSKQQRFTKFKQPTGKGGDGGTSARHNVLEKPSYDRKLTGPRAARDPRRQFWESSNNVSPCLPSKRPIHETTKESSMEWKPIKWNHSRMFSLHESEKAKFPNNDVREATNIIIETTRKKPRLNWGEGLAKFEKNKSEATTVVAATSSFVTFNSLIGVGDALCMNVSNMGNDVDNLDVLADDVDTLTRLGCSLVELLQSNDPSSTNSCIAKSTTMTKVTLYKAIISKVLEVIVTKIDSLEKELESLQYEFGDKLPCLTITDSLLVCQSAKSCDADFGGSNKDSCLEPLQITPSNEENMETLCNMIISSNKDIAKKASEAYAKLLLTEWGKIIDVGVINSSLSLNDASIKEKFVEKERFSRFKVKALTIKYKAFNYLWKKDLSLRILRKNGPTSQKKLELVVQTVSNGCKKNRSSICDRFRFPGNQLSLVPTSEMITYSSQLISESHNKVNRNILKMPELILNQKDKMLSMFKFTNGLVEDPLAIEKERAMINLWTSAETNIFLDKFATFGKDFRKIASFLHQKTTADCIEFYYKNYKPNCLEKSKEKKDRKSQKLCKAEPNLMTSGKTGKCKVNVNSHDVLAKALVKANGLQGNQRTCSRRPRLWRSDDNAKISTSDGSNTKRSSSYDILQDERESVAVEVLVGKFSSSSSKARSSFITRSIDPRKLM